MKPYKIVSYRFGIFKNDTLEEFIKNTLEQEPEYNLFQVVEYSYWTPAGTESVRYLILEWAISV